MIKNNIPKERDKGRAGSGRLTKANIISVRERPKIIAKITRIAKSHPSLAARVTKIP